MEGVAKTRKRAALSKEWWLAGCKLLGRSLRNATIACKLWHLGVGLGRADARGQLGRHIAPGELRHPRIAPALFLRCGAFTNTEEMPASGQLTLL